MIRTIALLLLSVAAILFLAGCQQSLTELKKEAEYVKTCEDAGGTIHRYGFTFDLLRCDYGKGN